MTNQIIKKYIWAFLVLILAGSTTVLAQSDGDYVIVSINGSETYDVVSMNPVSKQRTNIKVFRHGKIEKDTVKYLDPNEGIASAALSSVKVRPFTMPAVGDSVYVLDESGTDVKVLKITVKTLGPESLKLVPKNDSWNGFHYATEEEFGELGWKLYDPNTHGKFTDVSDEELAKIEQEAFEMVNEARRDPSAFADKIEKAYKPDETVKETLRFLRNIAQKDYKFGQLERDEILDKVAREHARDIAKNPDTNHQGTSADCSVLPRGWVACRLERYGNPIGGGENIYNERTGGTVYNGSKAVMNLTLDHGVSDRGHRALFFDEAVFNGTFDDADKFTFKINKIGVGAGYDKTTGWISVVFNFVTAYEPKH